ncbi:hypothetical protein ACFSSA_14855 [Luteolibacter algae]|uniref:TonB C-terminal domain-containing protein n=1 Tax=Luteolibacter algae TaxID=454151 RepID=A0ABW5DAW9_9BACT
MIKDDLIFEWRHSDSHLGRKLLALALVAAVFSILVGTINVKLPPVGSESLKTASVMRFTDDALGRAWRLKAEEEGPFPGRLDFNSAASLAEWERALRPAGDSHWLDYEIETVPLPKNTEIENHRLAEKGVQVFPKRQRKLEAAAERVHEHLRMPVLIPFSQEALKWMPDELPEFAPPLEEGAVPASWRFTLSLRANGTVDQCFSLLGGNEPGVQEMIDWLKSLHFKRTAGKADGERWLGLRVEFINKENHGSDAE